MAIKNTPPEPDLPNIRKPLRATPLWRVFGWGSAATIALAAVALTSQTEAGSKRLQLAFAFASDPTQVTAQIPWRAAEAAAKAETKRLAAQLRDLAADRERLTARIAVLEREDVTGSIKQQSEQLAAARAAANSPPPAPSAPATMPAVVAAAPPPAPALPALTPLAMPALGETAASWPAATTTPQAEQPAAQPQAPQAAAEPVPLPPVRVADAPANEPVAEPPPAASVEFGIDLGGASSMEALRIHWAALKANYGPLLVGLQPLAAQHPKRPSGIMYRLVVGPLPNAAEAARLCARFPAIQTGCHPAKFSGEQLAAR